MKNVIKFIGAMAIASFSTGALAIPVLPTGLDDDGVVGSIWIGTQSANLANEIEWGQYLLDMGESASITIDANNPADTQTEDYTTGDNAYAGTLTGGTKVDGGSLTGFLSYEYVMAKYDGQKAGYIMYNVDDYVATFGNTLPEFSYPIWGEMKVDDTGKVDYSYQLSHWSGFGSRDVPEPGIIALLAVGLLGMVVARRKKAV